MRTRPNATLHVQGPSRFTRILKEQHESPDRTITQSPRGINIMRTRPNVKLHVQSPSCITRILKGQHESSDRTTHEA
jgi:hypothetical protein